MTKRCDQDISVTDCDSPLCRICCPDERYSNNDDFEGYSMTNHSEESYGY